MNRPGAKTGRALIGHGNFNYRPIRTRFLAEMHGQRRQKKAPWTLVCPWRPCKFSGSGEVFEKNRAQIPLAGIRQNHDDGLSLVLGLL